MRLFPSKEGGNTWAWGPLWWNRVYINWWMEPTWPKPPRFSKSWVAETEEPWRAGAGYSIKLGKCHAVNFGLWFRRESPLGQSAEVISSLSHEQGDM